MSDWEKKVLGEAVLEPITYGIVQPGDYTKNGVPLIRGKDYMQGWAGEGDLFRVSHELHEKYKRSKVIRGDLLLSIAGYVGEVAIVPEWIKEANITQTTARIRCDEKILDTKYLLYFLQSNEGKEISQRFSKGSAQAGLNLADVAKFEIPVPPLPEQKKIAEILSGIDTMITKHNRKMVSLGHLQASLIENITLGTKEAGSRQATDIGECPADWTATKLGDIADFANGNSFKSEDWGESGYPIIRIQNLNGGNEFNYFSGRIEEKWFVPHGSLLFAWSGQRGKSFGPFIWEGRDGVLNQHIFKVTHANDIDRQYLFLLLKMVQLKAERDAHGFKDSFMHVKKSDIVSTSIAVPSLAVQKRLANSYTQLTLQISLEEKKMKFLKNIKKACSADLLSGRKRVSV
jgi:type I restriction enzyme S subunit